MTSTVQRAWGQASHGANQAIGERISEEGRLLAEKEPGPPGKGRRGTGQPRGEVREPVVGHLQGSGKAWILF